MRPVVSTEDEPVWYVMTSSHQTVEDRMNRYLYANGSELLTEQYSGGLDPKEAAETFLWRLEDAGDGLFYLVNAAAGLQVDRGNVADASNLYITLSSQGTAWELVPSVDTGVENAVENQFCLWDETAQAYMNAMEWSAAYHVTMWHGDQAGCSGWFFVPLEEEVTPPAEEWVVVANNTLSSATPDDVDLTGVSYMKGSIKTNVNAGVLEGLPYCCTLWGVDGYGMYLYVEVDVPRDGTYKFSYRMRLDRSNDGSADVVFQYDEGTLDRQTAEDCSSTFTLTNSDVIPAQVYESDRLELKAGRHYFGLVNTNAVNCNNSTNLYIGDFQLSWLNDGSVQSYAVNVDAGEGGSVTVLDGASPVVSGSSVAEGTELTITATPDEGYELATLTVNGDDFENGGSWLVVGDVNVVATFTEVVRYEVTWEVENGTIEVSDENFTTVNEGDQVLPGTVLTINAVPADGYELESLTVNGTEIDNGGDWEVTGDVHIVVVMVGTGIDEVAADGISYDSQAQLLRVNARQALEVYDVTGRKVVGTYVDGVYSVAGLKAGIYVAVVDGKVMKFRK